MPAKTPAKRKPRVKKLQNNPVGSRAKRDGYDELLYRAERAPKKDELDFAFANPPRKKRARRKKRRGGAALCAILSIVILLSLGVIGMKLYRYQQFLDLRDAVNVNTFFEGVYVDNVHVGGMTLNQAKSHFYENVEPRHSQIVIGFSNGYTFTAADMGYSSDYIEALEKAFARQKSGNVSEIHERMTLYKTQPVYYPVSRRYYSDELIDEFVATAARATDRPPTAARVSGFNAQSFEMTFAEGTPGVLLDQAALRADTIAALNAGGGGVTVKTTPVAPTVTVADISGGYGLRASAITNASSSNSNRLNNISLALSAINGVAIAPGDTFSFNETVGQRTTARGYKMAGAYSDGELTEQVGGGICQVSTTLFNAAAKGDLKITERHAHSLPVSYVDKGKDATVNWGSQDLRITNNTPDTIYIAAQLTNDKRVKIAVFGKLIDNGEYITIEAEVTETIDFQTVYQVNAFLSPGAVNQLQVGRMGYKAVAYKIRWTASGERIEKDVLCRSTYNKRDAIIEHAP